jgi:hypothetical protein
MKKLYKAVVNCGNGYVVEIFVAGDTLYVAMDLLTNKYGYGAEIRNLDYYGDVLL